MPYLKATVVGLLLAIAVATIDGIIAARMLSGVYSCPDPACTRVMPFVDSAARTQILVAFVLGFAGTFAWFLRRQKQVAP